MGSEISSEEESDGKGERKGSNTSDFMHIPNKKKNVENMDNHIYKMVNYGHRRKGRRRRDRKTPSNSRKAHFKEMLRQGVILKQAKSKSMHNHKSSQYQPKSKSNSVSKANCKSQVKSKSNSRNKSGVASQSNKSASKKNPKK